MFKLGKQTQYALVALLHLGRIAPGTRASTRELSERYAIPEPHLGKILQRLSKAGLLVAEKGSQGGYELGRPLELVRLGDVMEALNPAKSALKKSPNQILSAFPSCYMQGVVRKVSDRVEGQVASLFLNELLADVEVPELMENSV